MQSTEKLIKHKKTIFNIMGLQGCQDINLVDTKMPKVKQEEFLKKIQNAPAKGRLLVSGTACPIINILYSLGKTVVGISFPEYFDSRFDDSSDFLKPNAKDVVVIRAIGKEPAKNFEYSSKLLQGLLEYYQESLVILETHFSKTNFETTYGISVSTHITLQLQEENSWL